MTEYNYVSFTVEKPKSRRKRKHAFRSRPCLQLALSSEGSLVSFENSKHEAMTRMVQDCESLTDTLIEDTRRSPLGSAVNKKDDKAIAPRRAIRHDDRMAERLLIRWYTLCIFRGLCGSYTCL